MVSALEALSGPRHPRTSAAELAPRKAGLYAFYGDEVAWEELDLVPAFDDQPLYVRKPRRVLTAETSARTSLAGRPDPQRSDVALSALLVDALSLLAVPRNLVRADGSANSRWSRSATRG